MKSRREDKFKRMNEKKKQPHNMYTCNYKLPFHHYLMSFGSKSWFGGGIPAYDNYVLCLPVLCLPV